MAGYTTNNMQQNLAHNAKNTAVIAQIEDIDALDQLEAICQVKGVDCLFIGRMDLTVALGETDPNAPNVLKTVAKIVEVANKYELATGMFIANLDELDHWLKQRVSLFLLGSDHSFMLAGAKQLQTKFEQAKQSQ
jgi:2-keto-3-deoxy-L-rhamnonate aldolase RhmA